MTDSQLPTDLYPIPEAAQLLNVAPSTIYRRHRAGKLALYGWSRVWRVSLAELLPRDMRAPAKPAQNPRVRPNRPAGARARSPKPRNPGEAH